MAVPATPSEDSKKESDLACYCEQPSHEPTEQPRPLSVFTTSASRGCRLLSLPTAGNAHCRSPQLVVVM